MIKISFVKQLLSRFNESKREPFGMSKVFVMFCLEKIYGKLSENKT